MATKNTNTNPSPPNGPKSRKTPLQEMFGKLVRQRRLPLSLSQEQLAELADLHFTYISSVERGERNITLGNIAKLARALKCNLKDLMPNLVAEEILIE